MDKVLIKCINCGCEQAVDKAFVADDFIDWFCPVELKETQFQVIANIWHG